MNDDILNQFRNKLDTAIDSVKRAREEDDRRRLMSTIGQDLAGMMAPFLAEVASSSKMNKETIAELMYQLRGEVADASIQGIDTTPIITAIEQAMGNVQIPQPKVTVKIPPIKIPDIKMPNEMSIKGWAEFMMGMHDTNNPIPVQLRDHKGNPINLFENLTSIIGSGGGGKSDFFTIKGFSSSAYAEMMNADGRLKVSVETGGSGLTDAELRATAVPVSQVSGAVDSVYVKDIAGSVSTANSTTTTLGIGGVFTGTSEEVTNCVALVVSTKSDVVSATNGLSIQFSSDGTNWDHQDNHTIPAATSHTLTLSPQARYFRVVYTNGGTAQAYFRLQTICHPVSVGPTMEILSGDVSDSNFAITTRAVLAAKKPNGDYVNIGATAGGNIKVSIEELGGTALDVRQVSGAMDSVWVKGFDTSMAASLIDSSGIQYSGSNPLPVTLVSGGITSTISVGSTVSDGIDDGSAPVKIGGVARVANPTAVAGGDTVSASYDKVGRQLTRSQARDLTVTAYATLTNGTETTLVDAVAGSYLDLVYIMGANNSDVAVTVDIRPVTAGNTVMTLQVPANGVAGIACPMPLPQGDTGNNWTADLPDVTGTTVYLTALFSKEA